MPHFCIDELMALMMGLPFVGYLVTRARLLAGRMRARKVDR